MAIQLYLSGHHWAMTRQCCIALAHGLFAPNRLLILQRHCLAPFWHD
ncbi:MAG: hypothetical protein ACAF42_07325 [Limnothrix sp. BL-A-16]